MKENLDRKKTVKDREGHAACASIPDCLKFDSSWDLTTDSILTFPSTDESSAADQQQTISTSFSSHSSVKSSTNNNRNSDKVSVKEGEEDVHVVVSGTSFELSQLAFRQLEALPWELHVGSGKPSNARDNNSSDEITNQYSYHLQTSPDLFEILLNNILFDSFPDVKLLHESDLEELEVMVMVVGLADLHQHLQQPRRSESRQQKKYRQVQRQGQGGWTPFFRTGRQHQGQQEFTSERYEPNNSTGTSPCENYQQPAKRNMTHMLQAAMFSSSRRLLGLGTAVIRPPSGSARSAHRKITHEEWCASGVVI